MANLSQLLPITNNLVTQTDLTTSLASKVTGAAATSSVGGDLKLYEATANGTNYVSFKAPNTLAGNVTWVLPSVDGTNGQALVTNGSGVLAWGSASSQWTTSGSDIYYNTGAILGGNASSIGSLPLRFQSKGAAGGGSPGAGYSVISGNDEVAGHIVLASTAENSINISVDPQNLRASSSLQFSVDGSERARITSGGEFFVNTTSQPFGSVTAKFAVLNTAADYVATIANSNATPYGLVVYYNTDKNDTASEFLYCRGGSTVRATIRSNGGIANYSANNSNLSDRREKTNFAPAKKYLDVICAIPVQTFNYIDQNMEDDPGETLGVVAQDVEAVAPELVMESNWGTKENPKMRLSIYQTDLQYALMKCIQEQQAIITDLRARVAALEAA